MSEDKPEVGDVFKSPFAKYFVVTSGEEYSYCVVEEREFLEVRKIPTFYLKIRCDYLGKSKVNIEDLFKTENE